MAVAASRAKAPTSSGWRWGTLAAALALLLVFAIDIAFFEVHPGSLLGMTYGVAAASLMVGAALYGARRRSPRFAARRSLGSARGWLDFHLYGGGLFALLVLMHSGFRLPVGALNWGLWILAMWVAGSGAFGLALQRWIPRVLASGLSTEVHYDRIGELTDEIRRRAVELTADCDDSIRSLYRKKVAPALDAPERRLLFFLDPTGGIQSRLAPFRYLEDRLPPGEAEKLGELERLYRAKLEIDAHYTLQRALRGWLALHAPVSMVLLALVALHVFTVLYY